MTDTYGRWTYDPRTPESRKCDLDRIADMILDDGYTPRTDIENLAVMISLYYDGEIENSDTGYYTATSNGTEPTYLEDIQAYVTDSGGYSMFDYYA